tara:strand:- start:104 stop:784 length:681 start_codon:yes stop_codon:yes gene_type:complete
VDPTAIIIQHKSSIPTDDLLSTFARSGITGIKLRPNNVNELPSEQLIAKSSAVVLVDIPARNNHQLHEEEIKLIKRFRNKKKILALGTGTITAGIAHGAKVCSDHLRLGWMPATPTNHVSGQLEKFSTKILVNSNIKLTPPEEAKILLTSGRHVVAYKHNNLLSLDLVTNIDLTSYDLIIQKAIRQKASPSPRVQTVEELRYYRDKHLKPYRAEISNFLEHWLAKI